jgi:hypothetical protein
MSARKHLVQLALREGRRRSEYRNSEAAHDADNR